jgi:uncharacterized lipoprotein
MNPTSEVRFSNKSLEEIEESIRNTAQHRSFQNYVWTQFDTFCKEKGYVLNDSATIEQIASAMADWAFNMKKCDGKDYKETVVKVLWNSTAKQLQEKYFTRYGIKIDMFTDIRFEKARKARDAKRRELQSDLKKRKESCSAFTEVEYKKNINC